MRIVFSKNAWEEYVSWQNENKQILKKINELIREVQRTPYEGTGKPEPLKYELVGLWSRRINLEHRLVYSVTGEDVFIYSCRYHYDN